RAGREGPGGVGEHRPGAPLPVDVRAGPGRGARHRRQRVGEPGGGGAVGGDVPRPPGRARGGGGPGARRRVGAARAEGDGWTGHGDVDGPDRRDDRRPGGRDVTPVRATWTPPTVLCG